MKQMIWRGVIPAITTPFNEDMTVDHAFLARHCQWLVDNGCTGVVALGSLGEGATLNWVEKQAVIGTCVRAVGERACAAGGRASRPGGRPAANPMRGRRSDRGSGVCGCGGLGGGPGERVPERVGGPV